MNSKKVIIIICIIIVLIVSIAALVFFNKKADKKENNLEPIQNESSSEQTEVNDQIVNIFSHINSFDNNPKYQSDLKINNYNINEYPLKIFSNSNITEYNIWANGDKIAFSFCSSVFHISPSIPSVFLPLLFVTFLTAIALA